MLQIKIDQDQVARYGVPAKTVLDLVESIGSKPLGEVVEGQLRFPLVARLRRRVTRASPEAIGVAARCHRPAASGFPSRGWRRSRSVEGPSTITREWGQRRITVTANVRGRDLGSFVAEARRKIAEKVSLPVGPLPPRVRRPVREPAAGADPAADRRAGRAVC